MSNLQIAALLMSLSAIILCCGSLHLQLQARRMAKGGATSSLKVASLEPLQPLPVERDNDGWWSHPGVPDFDESQVEEYKAWLAAQGLEISYTNLEEEDLAHPAYVSYYDQGSASVAGWNPQQPAGNGWLTISIHDTEDGPYWVWARRVARAVAP